MNDWTADALDAHLERIADATESLARAQWALAFLAALRAPDERSIATDAMLDGIAREAIQKLGKGFAR
jgi:hypothetical protein